MFPVELENIQITNVRQLSDGRILYHFYIDDELGLRTLGFDYVEVNGEGHMYCVPKRALYTEKRETTSLADSGAGSGFGGVRGLGPRQRRG